jgi:hypothetical protein
VASWDGGGGGIGLFAAGNAQIERWQTLTFALSEQPTAGLVDISLQSCNGPMVQSLECSLVYAHDVPWS